MALVVGALLAAFSIAIVVYPFLRSRLRHGAGDDEAAAEHTAELGNTYDRIRTLQLEYQLGQVPEHLYREQLREYRLQAAETLRRQAEKQDASPDQLLEQEILAARAGLRSEHGCAPEACPNRSSLPSSGLKVCPECGAEPGKP